MYSCRSILAKIPALITCCALIPGIPFAHAASPGVHSAAGGHKLIVTHQPSGLEVVSAGLHERVVALRDDVVRIRAWRANIPPEDASWAVLTAARASTAPVHSQNSSQSAGFRTAKLTVEIDKSSLALKMKDADGAILLQVAPQPV